MNLNLIVKRIIDKCEKKTVPAAKLTTRCDIAILNYFFRLSCKSTKTGAVYEFPPSKQNMTFIFNVKNN